MKTFKGNLEQVKTQAEGHWASIVGALAPSLAEAVERPGIHCSCPVHGGSDGFRLFKDFHRTGGGVCNSCGAKSDGFALLAWAMDEKLGRVVRLVDEYLNGASKPLAKPVAKPAPKPKDDGGKNTLRLRKAWGEADSDVVRKMVLRSYLHSRGLPKELEEISQDVIRVHSKLSCWQLNEAKEITNYGEHFALLSLVETSTGEALTIHRTYLETYEKGWRKASAMPNSKTIMPLKSGMAWESCAVKLGKPSSGEALNIAEGIETSFAVIALGQSHCWAGINANNIGRFTPPKGVKEVVLWADLDRPCERGIRAGHAAAEKLYKHLGDLGIKLTVKFPPIAIPEGSKGVDWLDYYNSLPKHSV